MDLSDYEDKKQGINVWERTDVENAGTKLEEGKSPASSNTRVSLRCRIPCSYLVRQNVGVGVCSTVVLGKQTGGGEGKQGSVCVWGGGGGVWGRGESGKGGV